jgi:hypothetical protein
MMTITFVGTSLLLFLIKEQADGLGIRFIRSLRILCASYTLEAAFFFADAPFSLICFAGPLLSNRLSLGNQTHLEFLAKSIQQEPGIVG